MLTRQSDLPESLKRVYLSQAGLWLNGTWIWSSPYRHRDARFKVTSGQRRSSHLSSAFPRDRSNSRTCRFESFHRVFDNPDLEDTRFTAGKRGARLDTKLRVPLYWGDVVRCTLLQ